MCIYTIARLSYSSDWSEVEVTTPGASIVKDPFADDKAYAHVTFKPTSVTWKDSPGRVFQKGTVLFLIKNNGAPVDVILRRGRDGVVSSDHKGKADVTFLGLTYKNEDDNPAGQWAKSFKGCPVNDPEVNTPAQIFVHSDWAKIKSNTAGTVFRKDPTVEEGVYNGVEFTDTSIKWGTEQSFQFRDYTIPFVIVHKSSLGTVDVSSVHGRDGHAIGDKQGHIELTISSVKYQSGVDVNDDADNEKVFFGCSLGAHLHG